MEAHPADQETIVIECLRCGERRTADRHHTGECPRCTYVGWTPAGELTEAERRSLRERPSKRRRLLRASP